MVHSATHLLYRTRIEGCTCSNFQGYPCSKDWNEWCYYGNRKQIGRNRWRRFFFESFWFFVFSKNDTKRYGPKTIPNDTDKNDTKRYRTIRYCIVFWRVQNDMLFYMFQKRYRFSRKTTWWKMKNDTPVSFGVVFSKVTIWDPVLG